MIQNYLKWFVRSIVSSKLQSALIIGSLLIGLFTFSIMYNFYLFEGSYDSFHKNANRIFRINKVVTSDDFDTTFQSISLDLAEKIKSNFEEIETITKVKKFLGMVFRSNDNYLNENNLIFADENFYKVFSFDYPQNLSNSILKEPFNILLSENAVNKYFGGEDPVNKVIYFRHPSMNEEFQFVVKGVFKNQNVNSSIKFDLVASFKSFETMLKNKNTRNITASTFALLEKPESKQLIERQLDQFVSKHISETENVNRLELLNIKDVYYNKGDGAPLGDWGILVFSKLVLALTILVLIISSINFTNLSTSKYVQRIKEFGLRKSQGASKLQIFFQIFLENLFTTILTLLIVLITLLFAKSYFEVIFSSFFPTFGLIEPRTILLDIFNLKFLLILSFICFLIALISTIYPVLFMNKMSIYEVLKGEKRKGRKSGWFGKLSTAVQFIAAVVFINTTLVLLSNVDKLKDSDRGFNTEKLYSVKIFDKNILSKYELLKNELKNNPLIDDITLTSIIPGVVDNPPRIIKTGSGKEVKCLFIEADYNFTETLEFNLLKGQDFKFSDRGKNKLLINKRAFEELGLTESLNENIDLFYNSKEILEFDFNGTVVGVINDFKHSSIFSDAGPTVIKLNSDAAKFLLIKTSSANKEKVFKAVNKIWQKTGIKQNLNLSSVKEEVLGIFTLIDGFGTSLKYSAIVVILIAFMGLLAKTTNSVERRIKEVGIKKVLGASDSTILKDLAKPFLIMVFIANIVAIPLSLKLAQKVISDLPGNTGIDLIFIGVTLLLTVGFSYLIIFWKAKTIVKLDPVNTLRCE